MTKMSIGLIARQALYKVCALEKALILKGILTKGEVEQLYNDELREQAEEEKKRESEHWDQLEVGVEIEVFPDMRKPIRGILIGKSVRPWLFICLQITDRGSYHKHYKHGEIASFNSLSPSDVELCRTGIT